MGIKNNQLCFVTTNGGKLQSMKNHLAKVGIEVVQEHLDLIEPQVDTVEEVAMSKARQAFEVLQRPVLVDDSAFVIDELNGFPGPYVKFVLKTLGVERIIKFANQLRSRSCRFETSLVYVNQIGEQVSFTERFYRGNLSRKIDMTSSTEIWSDLWRVFVPVGATKPLSMMSFSEREEISQKNKNNSCYQVFGRWCERQSEN